MLRHARSFVALRPETFEEARSKELSEGQTTICLRGVSIAGGNPLEYEGGFAAIGRAASSGAQTDLAVAAVVKLASGSIEGPELLRHAQRPRYAQFLTSADESLLEPRKPAAAVRRVGRAAPPRPPVDTTKGTGGAITPEVAWAEVPGSSGSGGASPGAGDADVLVAQGLGTVKDGITGVTLYHGLWRAGVRHGLGKGAIYERRAAAEDAAGGGGGGGSLGDGGAAADVVPSVYIGAYEGAWALGLRHGRGFMLEVGAEAPATSAPPSAPPSDALALPHPLPPLPQAEGDRYEGEWAFDLRHGEGVESIVGGGSFRGCWCRGLKHG